MPGHICSLLRLIFMLLVFADLEILVGFVRVWLAMF